MRKKRGGVIKEMGVADSSDCNGYENLKLSQWDETLFHKKKEGKRSEVKEKEGK